MIVRLMRGAINARDYHSVSVSTVLLRGLRLRLDLCGSGSLHLGRRGLSFCRFFRLALALGVEVELILARVRIGEEHAADLLALYQPLAHGRQVRRRSEQID